MEIKIDPDKCIGCGKCREACPKGPIMWKINKIAHVSNYRYCHLCTLCSSACKQDAITIIRTGD